MMKVVIALSAVMLLSSCASLKRSFCDCCQDNAKTSSSSGGSATHSASKSSSGGAATQSASGKESIVVDGSDLEISNRMTKAVDAYVFKSQKDEFTTLCKDERFDCYVNDKRFPKGHKKIKRKVPPYLSGSKMGLQGETRIRVKYDFYP